MADTVIVGASSSILAALSSSPYGKTGCFSVFCLVSGVYRRKVPEYAYIGAFSSHIGGFAGSGKLSAPWGFLLLGGYGRNEGVAGIRAYAGRGFHIPCEKEVVGGRGCASAGFG